MGIRLRWVSLALMAVVPVALCGAQPDPNLPFPIKPDGAQVRASHILVKASKGKTDEASGAIAALKKKIEAEVSQELAKLPPEKVNDAERALVLQRVFGRIAAKESACPSKTQGGDIGWFTRHNLVVEPFAKAAFELPAFQVSEPVVTEFGQHLILVTDRKAAKK